MLTRNDPQHLRRRTWLIIWLQIMQELVGIGVVTVYAPTVFQQVRITIHILEIALKCDMNF
jgi:hypothetical protein